MRRTIGEFGDDELTQRSAALTYYSIMAIFPALLLVVSLLGMAGQSATDRVIGNVREFAPGSARQVLEDAVRELQGSQSTGSVLALAGLLGALWSASAYVRAFMEAANDVYEMPEGRPAWKITPVRLGLTAALTLLAAASGMAAVVTGGIAERIGGALGLGDAALRVWSFARWPLLLIIADVMLSLLYWAAPNVRPHGFRWITPGTTLAIAIWGIASAGFAVYVANFAHYNATYGAVAGIIVFLVWLRLANLAVLLGLEFDAELARGRAEAGGLPKGAEPYVHPRDTRRWEAEDYPDAQPS